MQQKITELGIINYKNFTFHDWELDENKMIRKLNFVSDLKNLQMDCILFFCFERKTVGQTFYEAIISSDILHNEGRVIIDDEFRTSDPSIYAAGPTTKYDGKYFAERFEQEHFCQAEIGRALGKKTIFKESPNVSYNQSKEKETFPSTVPRFQESIITNCFLPGGYNYLNVQVPGLRKITESFKNVVPLIYDQEKFLKKFIFRELLFQLVVKKNSSQGLTMKHQLILIKKKGDPFFQEALFGSLFLNLKRIFKAVLI